MKNAFNGFTSRLDTAKERISEFEGKSIEVSQIEMQRQKKRRKRTFKNCGTVFKGVTDPQFECQRRIKSENSRKK